MFELLKVLSGLVLPPASLLLGSVLGAAVMFLGWRRLGTLLIGLAIAQTAILSVPQVSDALLIALEDQARHAAAQSAPCCYDAIVVLGGGVAPAMPPDRPEPHLGYGADRVWEAARLYHRGVARYVIVTGGGFAPIDDGLAPTAAEAMQRLLVDLGVPAESIVLDKKARNTIENISNVHALVKDERVALVTSAFHMPRALRLARTAHLEVAAFPTDFLAVPSARPPWARLGIPSATSLLQATVALKEILALAFDRREVRSGDDAGW